jgi:hypothetical protein
LPVWIPELDLRTDLCSKDYSRAFDAFVTRAWRLPGVLAVGRFGNWGEPGISDIDGVVVVEDGEVAASRAALKGWIRQNAERSYLFWHPPLVLSRAALSHLAHLHSLDGLEWVEPPPLAPASMDDGGREHLDLVWATFITVIAGRICAERLRSGARTGLLVLKNIHMALVRLSALNHEPSRALERTRSIRARCLAAAAGEGEDRARVARALGEEFETACRHVMTSMDAWAATRQREFSPARAGRVWVRSDVRVERGTATRLHAGRIVRIEFNAPLFDLMLGPTAPAGGNAVAAAAARYKGHADAAVKISRKEGTPFPFIRPFNLPSPQPSFRRLLRSAYWAAKRHRGVMASPAASEDSTSP